MLNADKFNYMPTMWNTAPHVTMSSHGATMPQMWQAKSLCKDGLFKKDHTTVKTLQRNCQRKINLVLSELPADVELKYPALFKGIGRLKGVEVKLHIDLTVPPVVQKGKVITYARELNQS